VCALHTRSLDVFLFSTIASFSMFIYLALVCTFHLYCGIDSGVSFWTRESSSFSQFSIIPLSFCQHTEKDPTRVNRSDRLESEQKSKRRYPHGTRVLNLTNYLGIIGARCPTPYKPDYESELLKGRAKTPPLFGRSLSRCATVLGTRPYPDNIKDHNGGIYIEPASYDLFRDQIYKNPGRKTRSSE